MQKLRNKLSSISITAPKAPKQHTVKTMCVRFAIGCIVLTFFCVISAIAFMAIIEAVALSQAPSNADADFCESRYHFKFNTMITFIGQCISIPVLLYFLRREIMDKCSPRSTNNIIHSFTSSSNGNDKSQRNYLDLEESQQQQQQQEEEEEEEEEEDQRQVIKQIVDKKTYTMCRTFAFVSFFIFLSCIVGVFVNNFTEIPSQTRMITLEQNDANSSFSTATPTDSISNTISSSATDAPASVTGNILQSGQTLAQSIEMNKNYSSIAQDKMNSNVVQLQVYITCFDIFRSTRFCGNRYNLSSWVDSEMYESRKCDAQTELYGTIVGVQDLWFELSVFILFFYTLFMFLYLCKRIRDCCKENLKCCKKRTPLKKMPYIPSTVDNTDGNPAASMPSKNVHSTPPPPPPASSKYTNPRKSEEEIIYEAYVEPAVGPASRRDNKKKLIVAEEEEEDK
jgi:hypothetical protein